jgi:hypothetical protein
VYAPLIYQAYASGGYTWDSGAVVQNLSPQAAVVNTSHTGSGDTRASYSAANR